MKWIGPKKPRIKLCPDAYKQLRQRVLERDTWRCQNCGARTKLQVHHKELRSQSGDDSEYNLITLCHSCHSYEHRFPSCTRCS